MRRNKGRLASLVVLICLLCVRHSLGAEGDLLWQVQIDKFGGDDNISGIAADDSRVFVVGHTRDPRRPHPVPDVIGNSDFFVQAYTAATGALLWEDIVITAGPDDTAFAVVTDGQRVYVGGDSSRAGGNFDFLIRAYDAASGIFLWEDKVHTGGEFGLVRKLALRSERRVTLHSGRLFAISANGLVRAYEAATGTLIWEDKIGDPPFSFVGFSLIGRDLAVDKNRVFAVGRLDNLDTGDSDFFVRAYNANNGRVLFQSQVNQGSADDAVAVDAEKGNVFIAGVVGDAVGSNRDFLIRVHTAANGSLVWKDQVDKKSSSLATSVVVEDDRVFVGGLTETVPNDFFLRTYSAENGALLWENEIDNGVSIALAATNRRLFAAGFVDDDIQDDIFSGRFFIRAYDSQTGLVRWEDHGNTGFSSLHALTVERERLFAAGFVLNAYGETDALIRAYDARPQRGMVIRRPCC